MREIMLVPFPLASSKLLMSFLIFQISTFLSALESSKLMFEITNFHSLANKQIKCEVLLETLCFKSEAYPFLDANNVTNQLRKRNGQYCVNSKR